MSKSVELRIVLDLDDAKTDKQVEKILSTMNTSFTDKKGMKIDSELVDWTIISEN